jgi:hypothetical protein
MWKNMSLPSPVSMNPNPFSVSFLIFPSAITFTSKNKLESGIATSPACCPGTFSLASRADAGDHTLFTRDDSD